MFTHIYSRGRGSVVFRTHAHQTQSLESLGLEDESSLVKDAPGRDKTRDSRRSLTRHLPATRSPRLLLVLLVSACYPSPEYSVEKLYGTGLVIVIEYYGWCSC